MCSSDSPSPPTCSSAAPSPSAGPSTALLPGGTRGPADLSGHESEFLRRLRELFNGAQEAISKNPLRAACIMLCCKGLVCDFLVQTVLDRSEGHSSAGSSEAGKKGTAPTFDHSAENKPYDYTRTLILGTYSGFCEAPLAFFFYSVMFPKWFPTSAVKSAASKIQWSRVLKMLALDIFVLWPLCIYPTFYAVEAVVKHVVARNEVLTSGGGETVAENAERAALPQAIGKNVETYFNEFFFEVNSRSALVWVPVGFVNFSLVKPQLRTCFMGMCAFGYSCFWSLQQARLKRLRQRKETDGCFGAVSE